MWTDSAKLNDCVTSGRTSAASRWSGFIKTTSPSGRTFERTAASKLRRSRSQRVTHSRTTRDGLTHATAVGDRDARAAFRSPGRLTRVGRSLSPRSHTPDVARRPARLETCALRSGRSARLLHRHEPRATRPTEDPRMTRVRPSAGAAVGARMVALAAAGLAIAVIASSMSPPAQGGLAAAAPPPAFVVVAANRMARGLGDPQPSSAQYVLTRHETAVKAKVRARRS